MAGEEFQPVVVFVKPDGDEDFAILVFPAEARERAIADVTRQARVGGCQALIMVGGTWTAPPAPGREPRRGDAVNHPERDECMMLLLFTPNGSWGRTVQYRREGKEISFQPPGPWFPPDSPWNPWGQM